MSTPIPADRHKDLFPGVKVPRTHNFNPDVPSGASWIKKLPQLNSTAIDYNDEFYRARLQALQAVDEIVEGVIKKLEDANVLENTYVVYTTDNGYHVSQHRLPPGKTCSFETDIHIPLLIRGPGIPRGQTTDVVTAHVDLAPTFLKIAGVEPRDDFDGSAIPLSPVDLEEAKEDRQEHVNVEFWGRGIAEGQYGYSLDDGQIVYHLVNNTYKSLRLISDEYNLYYSVWCTNEHELYDLTTDPEQLVNLYPTSDSSQANASSLPRSLERLIPRLDALLMVTKSCKGETCREPWKVLHPDGDVRSLSDALKETFDSFYASVGMRVAFGRCELGYLKDAEGLQDSPVFGGIGNGTAI